jgi:selenium metabolism protein YedF
MTAVDARGRNCPQPVMMTKVRVDAGDGEIEVLLDNAVSASNVQRFLEKNGYRVRIMDEEGTITVRGVKGEEARHVAKNAPPAAVPEEKGRVEGLFSSRGTAILITRAAIGGEDPMLGEILVKSFLGTLAELADPPGTIALMNEGVKLALENTSSCDHLSSLARKGVKILVCGTCTSHFGISADIGAGVISNMFEITEALLGSEKTVSL